MATLPRSQVQASRATHLYHADAYLLDAQLEQPVATELKKQVLVELPVNGKIQYERAIPYQLKGIIGYQGGYSQVSGHPSTKIAGGFTTVATSVAEGVNVLDVVTADRVVAQISTTHPPYDPENDLTDMVPSVTFLGTRFDNLRVNGHKVEPERHLEIVGPKPANAVSYFDDKDFLDGIKEQYRALNDVVGLPEWAAEKYGRSRESLLQSDDNGGANLTCSLVSNIKSAPRTSFGHVIDLPHFGKIFLGELIINRKPGQPAANGNGATPDTYTFHLTMIRLELGCIAQGNSSIVVADSNGGSKPPKP